MQTYSHLILTAALAGSTGKLLKKYPDRLPPLPAGTLLLGSIMPDIPLILMAAGAIGSDQIRGVFDRPEFANFDPGQSPTPEQLAASTTIKLFDVWFFKNPWVIAPHNLFHSPLLLLIFMGLGYLWWRRGHKAGAGFFWLSSAAMLHTLIDIPLHVTDGPLPLFPLNWSWRFRSPISYWDPRFYGRQWSAFEHLLDLTLLLYLLWSYRLQLKAWAECRFSAAQEVMR